MEQVKEKINQIVQKYSNIKVTNDNDSIILNYYIDNKIYKALEITVLENDLQIFIYPDKIKRIIKKSKLKYIKELIEIFNKQNINKKYSKEEIEQFRKKYPFGTKIELIKMYDYISPIPPKTKGIIGNINELGIIDVMWENKRSLNLVLGIDEFKLLEE